MRAQRGGQRAPSAGGRARAAAGGGEGQGGARAGARDAGAEPGEWALKRLQRGQRFRKKGPQTQVKRGLGQGRCGWEAHTKRTEADPASRKLTPHPSVRISEHRRNSHTCACPSLLVPASHCFSFPSHRALPDLIFPWQRA